MKAKIAKHFWTGRSQAVRLPKEFRLSGETVQIRRRGAAVILEPVEQNWDWLDAIQRNLVEDFLSDGRSQPARQDREELDPFFED